ncbi:CCA tRNA nucleotidyltransferase [Chitinispirillales bacterium ANBcel5]|uniref:CCA tRNA nucleotidyltransferase n=1 Tax=Cellulosispirillum alkaliphilum TaxID=3039283 RepID=UPI002A51497C|nr:CCA tRNA nucleotidyltransferase [Chitinispirillales bacterium ANBcel5]
MKNYSADEQLQAATHILTTLIEHGYQALIAGGYVRDLVMQQGEKSDIDIATDATPATITGLFSQTIAVGEQFGVIVVIQNGIPFEVATFRSDVGIKDGRHPVNVVFTDAQTDAQRRDFTLNGMFYNPFTQQIIDYVDGRSDISHGLIRAIGDPPSRFREDYLRPLRAIRFAARFSFTIEDNTWQALRDAASGVDSISPERVFSEVDKMLRQPNPHLSVKLLYESGLLAHILPEVESLWGIEQPPQFHPEGDVFAHTLKALSLMPPKPSSTLAWAVLLHDIGKPPTMSVSDRIRFNNHHHVGAQMSHKVLKRLRAPNVLIEQVSTMVENHMNFMNVTKMRLSTLKKFLSRPTITEELELHRVDCLSSHGDLSNYFFIKEKLSDFEVQQIKPPALLSGKDLIELGLKPGPLFGEILGELYDMQLEEQLFSKQQALEIVREKWG